MSGSKVGTGHPRHSWGIASEQKKVGQVILMGETKVNDQGKYVFKSLNECDFWIVQKLLIKFIYMYQIS